MGMKGMVTHPPAGTELSVHVMGKLAVFNGVMVTAVPPIVTFHAP
jgi:hypothetical protein